jgi:glycosyltransferase involved in cell wall biosynthesis
MTKVSIIIPAYNSMHFLPKTIDSVLAQTFEDYEVIVVNDGSSDGIEYWAKQITNSRIKFIAQENQGQSIARNTGLTYAEGEYIAFLDSDDLWAPTKLEKQVGVLEKYPEVGFVHTWVALIDTKGRFLGKVWRSTIDGDAWAKLIEGNIIACGSVPMIRRSCIETVGLFQKLPFCCEDWDMWLRIAEKYQFKVVREILVYYRENPVSLSRSKLNEPVKRFKNMEQSYNIVLDKAFKSGSPNLQYLKSRSYAFAYLRIAWIALNRFHRGYIYAAYFRQRAVSHYSQLSFLKEYKRLGIAILTVRLLGFESYLKYKKAKNIVYNFVSKLRYKNI